MKKYLASIIRLIISLAFLVFSGILWLFVRIRPARCFPVYRTVSKTLMAGISAVTGKIPVSIWDIGAALLFLAAVSTLSLTLIRVAYAVFQSLGIVQNRTSGEALKSVLSWLTSVLLAAVILASLALDGWMLNHYAPPLVQEIGLETGKYTEEELYRATKYYMDCAASLAPEMERDGSGALIRQDFGEAAALAGQGYESLAEKYEIFRSGSKARVKKLSLTGNYFLKRGITGIFMPITAESSVPEMIAVTDVPYTMLHEVSHRLGIASEEEANFAAYLACEASEDPYFQYSGYYSAYVYCHNKLVKAGPSWNERLMTEAEGEGYELLFADTKASAAWYRSLEKEKAVEKMTRTNDTYLKTFSQEDGVKSYGEVVNDLIAWFLQKN